MHDLTSKIFGMPAGTARWVGFGAFVLGIAVAAFAIVNDPQGLPRRYWARYLAHIAKQQRRLFIFTPPQRIAYGQLAGIFACGAAGLLDLLPLWYVFAIGVAVLPAAVLENMRKKRVEQIEDQIDGFILALANALKATPSLGDGFKSVAVVVPNPIRQEIELAIKEMRVGATLDQALLMMASRVGSRQLDTALSSVLIGRQVGGNLPKILDSTAMSLREMKRLEGVVRTKTAEGKMQLWVLAVFPLFLIGSIESLSPGYFAPLTDSFSGYVVTFIASLFWIASLIVARKVLSVDI